MTKQELYQLELIRASNQGRIDAFANARMERLTKWLKRRYPNLELKILFGNGSELVKVDGKDFDIGGTYSEAWGRVISEAITDIWDITNGYQDGCPNCIGYQG